jgi:hypothetical protein
MKRKALLIAALAAVGLSGCKKYLDQVANPNEPSVATPALALTGAEKVVADIPNGIAYYEGGSYTQYGYWDGTWATSSGYIIQPAITDYNITTSNFQVWTDLYLNISNLKNLETLATANAAPDYASIAQILEAYDWQQLVDNYNDCPYSQAFNTKILFPTFDKGAAIYAAEITALDNAMAAIQKNGSASAPGGDDIIFGGNMQDWILFANTLKLRYIMRESNLSNFASLKTELNSTASLGYLSATVDAEANPGYTLNDAYNGQESPFWHAYGTTQAGNPEDNLVRANKYAINLLHSYNDPRLFLYYTPVTAPAGTTEAGKTIVRGLYLGDPQTSADTNAEQSLSTVGPGLLKSPSMNAIIFSAWESLFLQAEAVNDGMLTPPPGVTAESLYEAAITASFANLGLPASQALQYYSQPIPNVNWAASSANLEQAIITQKYIALNGYGELEQYNELRRTGYPVGIPRSEDEAVLGTVLPTRILYPQVEYDTNDANVAGEGTIDQFSSKIFWAK